MFVVDRNGQETVILHGMSDEHAYLAESKRGDRYLKGGLSDDCGTTKPPDSCEVHEMYVKTIAEDQPASAEGGVLQTRSRFTARRCGLPMSTSPVKWDKTSMVEGTE